MVNPEGERIRALEVQVKELGCKIDSIAGDIKDLKSNRGFYLWIQTIIGVIIGSVATFLVIEFLKTH